MNELHGTLYPTFSAARQAAWDAGFSVINRPDTRDFMGRGDTVILLERPEGCSVQIREV